MEEKINVSEMVANIQEKFVSKEGLKAVITWVLEQIGKSNTKYDDLNSLVKELKDLVGSRNDFDSKLGEIGDNIKTIIDVLESVIGSIDTINKSGFKFKGTNPNNSVEYKLEGFEGGNIKADNNNKPDFPEVKYYDSFQFTFDKDEIKDGKLQLRLNGIVVAKADLSSFKSEVDIHLSKVTFIPKNPTADGGFNAEDIKNPNSFKFEFEGAETIYLAATDLLAGVVLSSLEVKFNDEEFGDNPLQYINDFIGADKIIDPESLLSALSVVVSEHEDDIQAIVNYLSNMAIPLNEVHKMLNWDNDSAENFEGHIENGILTSNLNVEGTVNLGSNLDLDGYTINSTINDDNQYSLVITGNATISNGDINGVTNPKDSGQASTLLISGGANVTLENLNVTGLHPVRLKNVNTEGNPTVTINSGSYKATCGGSEAVYVQCGKVTINGGTFEANTYNGKTYGLNILDSYRKTLNKVTEAIEVLGGTFIGFNPANCDAEGPGTNFVPEGYESKEEKPGVWVVTKKESNQVE